MTRLLAVALCLSFAARAESPDGGTDVPLAYAVDAGSVLADDAICMPPSRATLTAKRIVSCEAERDSLRASNVPLWLPIVVGLVALGAGASIGYAVGHSAQR